MQFFTTDVDGMTLVDPERADRREVLDSVREDPESAFPEVYLTLSDGRVLGYRAGGTLFEEEEGEVIRMVRDVDVESAENAWEAFINGDHDKLDALPWIIVD